MVATLSAMGEYAIRYRRRGWSVFPVCTPIPNKEYWCLQHGDHRKMGRSMADPGKHPLVNWREYQTRLPTEDEIRTWWTKDTEANIGVVTGTLSGVVVLDADGFEAHAAVLSRGDDLDTPTVLTGKPSGYHWYFAHPGYRVQNFAGRKGIKGLDFRGDGGYAVLPPSLHKSGIHYRWHEASDSLVPEPLPTWLARLLSGVTADEGAATEADTEHLDFDHILDGLSQGERDDTIWRLACRMRGDNVAQDLALFIVRQVARSAIPSFDESVAAEKVYRAWREYRPNIKLGGLGTEEQTGEPETPVGFLSPISELLLQDEIPVEWLVDDLFSVGSNGFIGAEPKVGKSWIGLELALALSTGTAFMGHFAVPDQQRVVYIQEEDSLARVHRRLKQLVKGSTDRPEPADTQFRYSIRAGFKIDRPDWIERLRYELDIFRPAIVILDVFAKMHLKDENSAPEMAQVLDVLETLRREYGCCFVIVHHFRKNPGMGASTRGNQMLRGSSALAGWGECSVFLRKGRKKHQLLVEAESKDAPQLEEFSVFIKDMENGGVQVLADVETVEDKQAEQEGKVLETVEALVGQHTDATVARISEVLHWKDWTTRRILKALVDKGELTEDSVLIGRTWIKLYGLPE